MPAKLVGLYSDDAEAAVDGNVAGLHRLADALASGTRTSLSLDMPKTIEPYHGALATIEIVPGEGLVVQSVAGSSLRFSGSVGGLATIAENVRNLASGCSAHIFTASITVTRSTTRRPSR